MSMRDERVVEQQGVGQEGADRIDAAIDAAARSLIDAEPSAALRVHVRERILAASAYRRKMQWALVPVVATATVIVVALVLGGSPSAPAVQQALQAPPPPAATPRERAPVTEIQRQAIAASLPPMRRLVTFEVPQDEVESLIPPIAIAPLETKQISVDVSSGVMPIEIEPLRIEPLQGE